VGMVSYNILMIMSNVTSIQLNTRVRETKRRDSTVTEAREREREKDWQLASWAWAVRGWARLSSGSRRVWAGGGNAVEL
jgi:hypothetical protein